MTPGSPVSTRLTWEIVRITGLLSASQGEARPYTTGEAALDVTAQLSSGHVEVRLAGREPQLVVVDEPDAIPEPRPQPDDSSARITLRLGEALKLAVETAADREQISTNTWIVRTLGRALEPKPSRIRNGNRLQGYAQS